MSQIRQLYRLQQYDSEITQKKRRLGEVVQLQRETAALIEARRRAAETAAEVSSLTTTLTDFNLELGGVNDKATRSERRLYSGKVTNPKELEDLQNEVAALGRRRGVLEDEVLETMILLEEAQAAFAGAQDSLSDIEAAWQQSQTALQAEQNELALALHGLMGERQDLAERIDPATLSQYESIRARKNGLAVVAMVNNACSGCHVGLSEHLVKQVERGEKVMCNGCGRILVPL